MSEKKMPHTQHEKHLCYLNNLEFQKRFPDEYIAIVKNSKYYCEKCGRTANDAENLCKPLEL